MQEHQSISPAYYSQSRIPQSVAYYSQSRIPKSVAYYSQSHITGSFAYHSQSHTTASLAYYSQSHTTVSLAYYSQPNLFQFLGLVRRPLFGLLYQPRIMDEDECVVVGGMSGIGSRSTRRKPAPAQLCPPQIQLDLTWARIQASAVENQGLTTVGPVPYSELRPVRKIITVPQIFEANGVHCKGDCRIGCAIKFCKMSIFREKMSRSI
jgi:hypothetical protein